MIALSQCTIHMYVVQLANANIYVARNTYQGLNINFISQLLFLYFQKYVIIGLYKIIKQPQLYISFLCVD